MKSEIEITPEIEEKLKKIVKYAHEGNLGEVRTAYISYLSDEEVFLVDVIVGSIEESLYEIRHFLQTCNGKIVPAEDMEALHEEYIRNGISMYERPQINFYSPQIVKIEKELEKDKNIH